MTTERRSAVVLVVSLLLVSLSPVVGSAAADDAIHLSVDVQHVVLTPGGAANVTLTITNNGSSICLLYTSPSPRDRQKSRMPSSA